MQKTSRYQPTLVSEFEFQLFALVVSKFLILCEASDVMVMHTMTLESFIYLILTGYGEKMTILFPHVLAEVCWPKCTLDRNRQLVVKYLLPISTAFFGLVKEQLPLRRDLLDQYVETFLRGFISYGSCNLTEYGRKSSLCNYMFRIQTELGVEGIVKLWKESESDPNEEFRVWRLLQRLLECKCVRDTNRKCRTKRNRAAAKIQALWRHHSAQGNGRRNARVDASGEHSVSNVRNCLAEREERNCHVLFITVSWMLARLAIKPSAESASTAADEPVV